MFRNLLRGAVPMVRTKAMLVNEALPAYPVRPAPVAKWKLTAPKPRQELRTFADFCEVIGRSAKEHAEAFGLFEEFLAAPLAVLKEKGIDTLLRRYMLRQRHRWTEGHFLRHIKQGKKYHGGEYKRLLVEARWRSRMQR